MRKLLTFAIFAFFGVAIATFSGCQQPPTITVDPDITGEIAGPFSGNYVVNYADNPGDNFSSQINLVVSGLDKKLIHVATQGGDSFDCTISGSSSSMVLSDIKNGKGVYQYADTIDGFYNNGRLYYKVTGTINGGAFYAEFTVI
tara:strand:- start:86114 stop:86545 length:432 start_codon:yes stop_codon:yes gene_type:complete